MEFLLWLHNAGGVEKDDLCILVAVMPVIFFRVVCGLCVTIESLQSSSALSRVDLPALGAPIMLMNPQANLGLGMGG